MTAPAPMVRQALRDAAELWEHLHHLDRPAVAELRARLTPNAVFAIACVLAAASPDPPEPWQITWLDDLYDADPTHEAVTP